MGRKPKTEADLRAWEEKKGFRGVISGCKICRKCVECDQPTRSMDETHCPQARRQADVRPECQVEGCTKRATVPRARCARAAGSRRTWRQTAAPRARSSPSPTRAPTGCAATACARRAVRGQARAGRAELAQLCEEQEIEEGPADVTDAAFRHALRRAQPEGRPQAARDGAGRHQWTLACAVRGCPAGRSLPPARPTRTAVHTAAANARTGGAGQIAWSATRTSQSAPIAARGALGSRLL